MEILTTTSFTILPDEGLIYIHDGKDNYSCRLGSHECSHYLQSRGTKIVYDHHQAERLLTLWKHPAHNIVDFGSWIANNNNSNKTILDAYWRELSSAKSSREYILLSNVLMYRIYNSMLLGNTFTQINSINEANNQIIYRYRVPISEFNQESLNKWINLGLFKILEGYVYLPDLSG